MADDVTVSNNSGSTPGDYTVASDEVQVDGTNPLAQVQFVKIVDGTLNGTEPVAGSKLGGLKQQLTGVTLAAAAQVTVTGSIGDLIAANAARRGLIFRALSSNTQSVFYGPAGTTLTTGMEIKPGETFSFLPGEVPTNLVRALSTSGSQVVIVQESS